MKLRERVRRYRTTAGLQPSRKERLQTTQTHVCIYAVLFRDHKMTNRDQLAVFYLAWPNGWFHRSMYVTTCLEPGSLFSPCPAVERKPDDPSLALVPG